jgi:hypothetical protein
MNQEDKVALKDFLVGFATVSAILGVTVAVIAVLGWSVEPTEHKQETEVVGQYKECDIVRWSYAPLAEHKYFLYCSK